MAKVINADDMPAKELVAFINSASRSGCYTARQATLLRTAVKRMLGLLEPGHEWTVGDLHTQLGVFQDKVKQSSGNAYLSRVKRALRDHRRWYGQDPDLWLAEIQRKSGSPQQSLLKRKRANTRTGIASEIRLPTGRSGELRLPSEMSPEEMLAAVTQLEAVIALLRAQAAAVRPAQAEFQLDEG